MKIIISDNYRGLLFHDGKFARMLMPGKYGIKRGDEVLQESLTLPFAPDGYDLSVFLQDAELKNQLTVLEVPDQTLALHFVNGNYKTFHTPGRYAFWNVYEHHEFRTVDTTEPAVTNDVPVYLLELLPASVITKIEVAQYQKARLYYNRKFVRLLDEGTYYFWNNGTRISAEFADMRLLQMEISGQEMLTLDKITVRVNFVCHYKISDYVKIKTEIDDYEQQMHVTLQLALREYVGKYRLDEILENKDDIAAYALKKLKEHENDFYVKVYDAGVKDIILPGEIREIMNTVLIAEKRAQANVITRREEVASTRSLLNTAKLMEENQTLYKLKELEYLEKICENVGSITVNGGGDLLSELSHILKSKSCDETKKR